MNNWKNSAFFVFSVVRFIRQFMFAVLVVGFLAVEIGWENGAN